MEKGRLSLLRASIKAQSTVVERIFERIEERRRGEGEANLESLAYIGLIIFPSKAGAY